MVNSEGGYTVDPEFRMPTASEPPTEPATPLVPSYDTPESSKPSGFLVPVQSKLVFGFDPGTEHGVLAYREGDKITIMEEGRFVAQGVIGGTMKDGVQYKAVRNFDESHIVRGYD